MRVPYAFCALLAALSLPTASEATLGDSVKVRLFGTPQAALAGQPFRGTLEISSGVGGEASSFRLAGPGWSVVALRAPTRIRLEKLVPIQVEFEAVPADPSAPLVLTFELDGRTVHRSLNLSPRSSGTLHPGGVRRSRTVQPAVVVPTIVGTDSRTRPAEVAAKPRRKAVDQPSKAHRDDIGPVIERTITVHGRFTYMRPLDGGGSIEVGADGATVEVVDDDDADNDELGSTITNSNGFYTIDVSTADAGETNPDLFVVFYAENSHVLVQTDGLEIDYDWQTPVEENYHGSDLDLGTLQPADEGEYPALHILTVVQRGWRWLNDVRNTGTSYDLQKVEVQWPENDTDNSFYSNYYEEIHLVNSQKWSEQTILHEYAHHWQENKARSQDPGYCCGHSLWCTTATTNDAYNEGFPDWFGTLVARTFAAEYGLAAKDFDGVSPDKDGLETLRICDHDNDDPADDSWGDPAWTEGNFAAVLNDIADATNDGDARYDDWRDVLSMGLEEIFTIADGFPTNADAPITPVEFLRTFKNVYPDRREDLWETAMNCGIDYDQYAPMPVDGFTLVSTSHEVGGAESPDNTIDFAWTRPYDDASGVYSYRIRMSQDGPCDPWGGGACGNHHDYTRDFGVRTNVHFTTPALLPGDWYINIKSVDRAQEVSDDFVSLGPFHIGEPTPANLTFYERPGWAYPVVPRPDDTASADDVSGPIGLTGGAAETYLNAIGQNDGLEATVGGVNTRLLVDGVGVHTLSWRAVVAGGQFFGLNMGPVTVKGGRHTLEAWYDYQRIVAEVNEDDNHWAHQWLWTPKALDLDVPLRSTKPPERDAGWAAIPIGDDRYYNCDGYSFDTVTPGWWNAVVVYADSNSDDYDIRLHVPAIGQIGFAAYEASSSRPRGSLDAVVLNGWSAGVGLWNAAVTNATGGDSPYTIRQVTSERVTFGDAHVVSLAEGELIRLLEFNVSAANVGPVTFDIDVDPAAGPVFARFYSEGFTTGALLDDEGHRVTDLDGHASFDVNIGSVSLPCLLLHRDPVYLPEKPGGAAHVASGSIDVTVTIRTTPPDFLPYLDPTWHSALVPGPSASAGGQGVPAPTLLPGDAASTFLNFAVANLGGSSAPSMRTEASLDGTSIFGFDFTNFQNDAVRYVNTTQSWMVRGGRHTLTMRLDTQQASSEVSELNNAYGEQWIWAPSVVTPAQIVQRPAPPSRIGGWTDGAQEPLFYGCDGIRMAAIQPSPDRDGYWGAVALMPGDTTNVDLRLHEASQGAKDGFGASLATSAWARGSSDFVLVNFNRTELRAFDAGILNWGGDEAYVATVVRSVFRGSGPGPTGGNSALGPFTLATGGIVDLHELWLLPGGYHIQLESLGSNVDWGLSAYGAETTIASKSNPLPYGASWFGAPGQGETIELWVPTAGFYALAVWKAKSSDLPLQGTYRLLLGTVTDTTLPPLPSRTALASIHPNPFNPTTSIDFDLARAANVRLAVFDPQGRFVRTLAHGQHAGGHHVAMWDGRDHAGHRVASGVYLVRLDAGSVHEVRKAIVLK